MSRRVWASCAIAGFLAVGVLQLLAGLAPLGFGLVLLGAIGGVAFIVVDRRDPSYFGNALQALLEWISSLR